MQIGQNLKIKKYDPAVVLYSLRYAIQHLLEAGETQLEHQSVPFTNVKTRKILIGGVGVEDCDYNFATAANTTEQVIEIADLVPAFARILDVKLVTEEVFTGATTLVAEVGTSSSGHELCGSATIYAANAINAMASDHAFTVAPVATAGHVFVAATPGANWSGVTAGKVALYVTYIEI